MLCVRVRVGREGPRSVAAKLVPGPPPKKAGWSPGLSGLKGLGQSSKMGEGKTPSSLSDMSRLRKLLSLEKRRPRWLVGDARDMRDSRDGMALLSIRLPVEQSRVAQFFTYNMVDTYTVCSALLLFNFKENLCICGCQNH